MMTPGMMMFAGVAVGVYGLSREDGILFWLGVALVVVGAFLWWNGDN